MKKFFYVVVLLAMALTMVACGGKNESGGSSGSSNVKNTLSIQTVKGTVDFSNVQNAQYFVDGNNQRFYIQDSSSAMARAWQVAQSKGIFNNTSYIKRVTITGIFNLGQAYNQGQVGYYPGQQQGMTVIPSNAVITNR